MGQKDPGTTIHLQVMREGKNIAVPVTLEAMGSRDKSDKETADAGKGKPRWGMGLSDITPEMRQQLQAPDGLRGAVIQQVQPGSPADNAGLQPGDVIVEVDRKPVHTPRRCKEGAGQRGQGTRCPGAGVVKRGQQLPSAARGRGRAGKRFVVRRLSPGRQAFMPASLFFHHRQGLRITPPWVKN